MVRLISIGVPTRELSTWLPQTELGRNIKYSCLTCRNNAFCHLRISMCPWIDVEVNSAP